MKDKSILEIDTSDIQNHYNGNNISYDDLVKFAENKVSSRQTNQSIANQHNHGIVNSHGFYVPQTDYIEYQIAKREAIKKKLRQRKINASLWASVTWLLKTTISLCLIVGICWVFYLLVWMLQKTF